VGGGDKPAMTVLVKICGLNSTAAADAALASGADFGGLVFFPPSPRHVGTDQAKAIAARLRSRARVVALFVDPDDATLAEIVRAVSPDLVQLHGNETPARVAAIAALAGRPVIKAVAIGDSADMIRAAAYDEVADYVLLDAKADPAATRPGGLGAAFDWKLLSHVAVSRPWGIAGGLSPDNVARALSFARPAFVDASSGVEDAPGVKSAAKIAAFVSAARNARIAIQEGAA
jgi:phosphoribosylanthranilate isomerase